MNNYEKIIELLTNSDIVPSDIKKILYQANEHYHDFVKDQDDVYSIYKIRLSLLESKKKKIPDGLENLIITLETNKYGLVRVHGIKFKDHWVIAFTNESLAILIGVIFLDREQEEMGNVPE